MTGIYDRGHIPILTGCTGDYVQAVLDEIDFTKESGDDAYRKELEDFAERSGAEALHERLAAVDPKAAKDIHPHNIKRVIRALEYHHQTGDLISRLEVEFQRPDHPLAILREAVFCRLRIRRRKPFMECFCS